MSLDNGEPEQDLSRIHWSWPEAIAANPTKSLSTPDLAMDYFAFSPFWDNGANNNILRTQRRVENPAYGHKEEKIELQAFKSGYEYIIAHSLPPNLFVVHKREVENEVRNKILGIYFILEGKIYPTPSLYDVMASRVNNATHLISKTFATLSAAHPPANPRMTSQWRSLPSETPPSTSTSNDKPTVVSSSDPSAEANEPIDTDPAANAKEEKASMPVEPDWKLFHALSTTRASLSTLSELASSPPPERDLKKEIQAIEVRLSGGVALGQNSSQSVTDGRTRSVVGPGSTLGVGGVGTSGIGGMIGGSQMLGLPSVGSKAGSVVVSVSQLGASPLTQGWSGVQ